MPLSWHIFRSLASHSRSRNARPPLVAAGGQVVEVTRRCLFHSGEVGLSGSASDHDGQMIGRAGRGAEVLDLLLEKFGERLFVQQRFGLLVEERLVGRSAALGDEQKTILAAGRGVKVDLCGQIVAAVLLVGHRERHDLRVAQVAVTVGLVHSAGDVFCIVRPGVDVFAFLADADGRTGVLAGGKFALGGHDLVDEHGVGHESVVVRCLGVLENVGQFLQVGGTQVERYVGVSLAGEKRQSFGIDFEDFAAVTFDHFHVLFGEQAVLGGVFAQRKRLLILEFRHVSYGLVLVLLFQ